MPITNNPGDGRAAILSIVSLLESQQYDLADVVFSTPVANADIDPIRNTKVEITFTEASGFTGKKTITYNRIHISELPIITVSRGTATRYLDLLPIINTDYNLYLTANDIVDADLPYLSTTIDVILPISDTSFLYYKTPQITTVGTVPPYNLKPAANTLLGTICIGTDKYGRFTDGYGGEYTKLVEQYSVDCGFIPGTPTTAAPSTTIAPTTSPPVTTVPPVTSTTAAPMTTPVVTTTPPPTTTESPTPPPTTTVPVTTEPPVTTTPVPTTTPVVTTTPVPTTTVPPVTTPAPTGTGIVNLILNTVLVSNTNLNLNQPL